MGPHFFRRVDSDRNGLVAREEFGVVVQLDVSVGRKGLPTVSTAELGILVVYLVLLFEVQ